MAQQAILRANKHRREATAAAASLGGGDCSRPGSPSLSSPTKDKDKSHLDDLRRALKSRAVDLYRLFGIWDADGNGTLDALEFKRAITMLGLRANTQDFEAICALCDRNGDGVLDLEEVSVRSLSFPALVTSRHLPTSLVTARHLSPSRPLTLPPHHPFHPAPPLLHRQLTSLIESTEESHEQTHQPPPRNPLVRVLKGVYWFINLMPTQTALYLAVVLIFQLLTDSLR